MNKTSCTIMFVDISGSTQIYEQLGDEVAKQTIDKCLAQISDIVVAHQGTVVKSIGDELMCVASTPPLKLSSPLFRPR